MPSRKSKSPNSKVARSAPYYRTRHGRMFLGTAEKMLDALGSRIAGSVQLILTSPPFPLNRKKKYGNLQGAEYVKWLADFAPLFKRVLREDGSLVIEMGNAWDRGSPTMSTLSIEALLALKSQGNFRLCQEFVWYNPARLPSPAQWVNIERIRVKDSFTKIWWLSPTERPKADNRRVVTEYSISMRKLLASRSYNSGYRPSEYKIGSTSFLTDNGGAIPPNVLVFPNTTSADTYQKYCRARNLPRHPARMPSAVATFFIKFLTEKRDLVLDPFAGSNTTGAAADALARRWISIEPDIDYVKGSRGRFQHVPTSL